MAKLKPKKPIPFEFVLSELESVNAHTRPMFGSYGLYIDNKIVFILRESEKSKEDNGIWLATTGEHHASLQNEFPSMRSIAVFGPGPTGWQVLPADSDDFEESVMRACELVRLGDPRIGKVPKLKLSKSSKRLKSGIRKKAKKATSKVKKKSKKVRK